MQFTLESNRYMYLSAYIFDVRYMINSLFIFDPVQSKPTKSTVHPTKTRISLGSSQSDQWHRHPYVETQKNNLCFNIVIFKYVFVGGLATNTKCSSPGLSFPDLNCDISRHQPVQALRSKCYNYFSCFNQIFHCGCSC